MLPPLSKTVIIVFVAFEAPGYWLQAIEFGEMEIYRVPGTFTFAAI
jgi:hypothetical protein